VPWLTSTDFSKKKITNQKESNDLPDFIVNSRKKAEIVNVEDSNEDEDKIIDITEGNT